MPYWTGETCVEANCGPLATPRFSRAHEQQASFSAAVSDQGRFFYILDDAPRVDIRLPSEWVLIALELPYPSLQPTLDSFQKAWQASDFEAIVAHYPDEFRESQLKNIRRSVELRNWEQLPGVQQGEIKELRDRMHAVNLTAATGGEVQTKWLLRDDGRWYLQGLKFPKR